MLMTTLLGRIQAHRNLINASWAPAIMYGWGERKLRQFSKWQCHSSDKAGEALFHSACLLFKPNLFVAHGQSHVGASLCLWAGVGVKAGGCADGAHRCGLGSFSAPELRFRSLLVAAAASSQVENMMPFGALPVWWQLLWWPRGSLPACGLQKTPIMWLSIRVAKAHVSPHWKESECGWISHLFTPELPSIFFPEGLLSLMPSGPDLSHRLSAR